LVKLAGIIVAARTTDIIAIAITTAAIIINIINATAYNSRYFFLFLYKKIDTYVYI
jgi:hypothetical protein